MPPLSVEILPYDRTTGHGSEVGLYIGQGAIATPDSLVLEVVTDAEIVNYQFIITDPDGEQIFPQGELTPANFQQTTDESGRIHYRIVWDCPNPSLLETYFDDSTRVRRFHMALEVTTTDGRSAVSDFYDFDVYNPSIVNERYREIASLPVVQNDNIGYFANGIAEVSQRIQDRAECTLKSNRGDLSFTECGGMTLFREEDLPWMMRANSTFHTAFSQGFAYGVSQRGASAPDVLRDFHLDENGEPQASATWQAMMDQCQSYNDSDETIFMHIPGTSLESDYETPQNDFTWASIPYAAGALGIGAVSYVFGSDTVFPLTQRSMGELACFSDLGMAHLNQDLIPVVQEIGPGSDEAWDVVMSEDARAVTRDAFDFSILDSIDVFNWGLSDSAENAMAQLTQAIYYPNVVAVGLSQGEYHSQPQRPPTVGTRLAALSSNIGIFNYFR